ncbi:hypothetical protein [Streptomyces sulphureus]|uniref:hypothetical protein n=1 Tax=Streptomyces sulphureus TaxID=47758 RepID=UPI00037FD1D8|nr:hypothetical protein [Streptomyces sulphureus]
MPCPSLLRGKALRATRLDACGRPVYGPCAQVVSDGFVTISMSPETEEGDAITVTKANGQQCVNEPGTETLSYHGLEMEFCEVDPDLVQIMNPSFEIYRDAEGNAIGWDESTEMRTDIGYALELWTDVYSGDADACSGTGAQGQWGYLLLPWVVGAIPGDLEITNDAVSFNFNGRTKVGSGWRRGPYNVQAGEGGVPGPMLKPVGPKVPRRFFVTTIRPPEPECGCQPVDRPTPDPADLYITGLASESDRKTVRLRADNHGFGPVMINWGDDSDPQEAADGAWITHVYDEDGEYTITACDKETPVICTSRTITVPLPADEPTLALTGEDYEVTALVELPSQSDGTALIDWGDGSEPEEITAGADGTVTVLHTYSVPSVYTVSVRRGDIDTFRAREAIVVPAEPDPDPEPEPAMEATADSDDETGRTVQITLTDFPASSAVSVDWGDETTSEEVPAGTTTATHAYESEVTGEQTITATSAGDESLSATATFTPGEGAGLRMRTRKSAK